MSQILKIPETLKLVSDCWLQAEAETSTCVMDMPFPYEETICWKLKARLNEASQSRDVEMAFLTDLQNGFPYIDFRDLRSIAEGVVADLTAHNKTTEAMTGGDFGLVIIRPQISRGINELTAEDYKRGLLCQAKRLCDNKWRAAFTGNQKDLFFEVADYYALVLYRLTEEHVLDPFDWQLCDGASLNEAERWLKKNSFPELNKSNEVIMALGDAEIGTDDPQIIEDKISPVGNPAIQIRIGWPDDGGPGGQRTFSLDTQRQKKVVSQVVFVQMLRAR